MTKKQEKNYSEIDIIIQAHADTMKKIQAIATELIDMYEGGMSMETAIKTAKEYYIYGVLAMDMDDSVRKSAEATVKKQVKERAERLKKIADKRAGK